MSYCRLDKPVMNVTARSDGGLGQYIHNPSCTRAFVIAQPVTNDDSVILYELPTESHVNEKVVVTSMTVLAQLHYHLTTKEGAHDDEVAS